MLVDVTITRAGRALFLLMTAALVGLSGCQVFTPGALGSLSASREEKRALKQAETDPFPSPADVGLDDQAEKP